MTFVVSFLGCFMAILVTKAIGYTMLQHAMRKTIGAIPEPALPPPLSPLEIVESARQRVDNGYVCSGCGHFEPGYDEKQWNKWIDSWRLVAKVHLWVDHYGIRIPRRCDHKGIGLPGCRICDPLADRHGEIVS
jgi:hypothetical protein